MDGRDGLSAAGPLRIRWSRPRTRGTPRERRAPGPGRDHPARPPARGHFREPDAREALDPIASVSGWATDVRKMAKNRSA